MTRHQIFWISVDIVAITFGIFSLMVGQPLGLMTTMLGLINYIDEVSN